VLPGTTQAVREAGPRRWRAGASSSRGHLRTRRPGPGRRRRGPPPVAGGRGPGRQAGRPGPAGRPPPVAQQDPPGDPVDHQVVHGHEQQGGTVGAEGEQHRPQQRARRYVEAGPGRVRGLLHRGAPRAEAQAGQVLTVKHRRGLGRRHVLRMRSSSVMTGSGCRTCASAETTTVLDRQDLSGLGLGARRSAMEQAADAARASLDISAGPAAAGGAVHPRRRPCPPAVRGRAPPVIDGGLLADPAGATWRRPTGRPGPASLSTWARPPATVGGPAPSPARPWPARSTMTSATGRASPPPSRPASRTACVVPGSTVATPPGSCHRDRAAGPAADRRATPSVPGAYRTQVNDVLLAALGPGHRRMDRQRRRADRAGRPRPRGHRQRHRACPAPWAGSPLSSRSRCTCRPPPTGAVPSRRSRTAARGTPPRPQLRRPALPRRRRFSRRRGLA